MPVPLEPSCPQAPASLPASTQGVPVTTSESATDAPRTLEFTVVRVQPEEWQAHRDLRLEMLEDAPQAFWARIEEVRERTEQEWRTEIAGPRIHLQARPLDGGPALGGIAVLPQGYTEEHVIPEDHAILVSMWVRPEARGRGISRELFRAAAELATQLGRPHLTLEVDSSNTRAIASYERFGFRPTGVTHPRLATGTQWVEYEAPPGALRLG